MKRLVPLFFLCALFAILFLQNKTDTNTPYFQKLFQSCDTKTAMDKKTCYKNIIDHAYNIPPERIKALLSYLNTIERDPSFKGYIFYHDIAHEIGMNLYIQTKDAYNSFIACGPEFQSGCYHAVVMEFFDTRGAYQPFSMTEGISFCNKLEKKTLSAFEYSHCVHGIGHVAAYKFKGDLPKALSGCNQVRSEDKRLCYDGVFMEYSRGETTSGFHSHQALGTKTLPCSKLNKKYKPSCYMRYGRSNPVFSKTDNTSKSFQEVATLCDHSEKSYRMLCFIGMARRLGMFTDNNLGKEKGICESMGKLSKPCKNGIVFNQLFPLDEPKDKPTLCRNTPSFLQNTCINLLMQYYKQILQA